MTKSRIEPLSNAYRLINPGVVVLVSVGNSSASNVCTVAWNFPVRKDPGLMGIVIGKRHHSYPFIAQTGEFAINVPDASLADAVLGCGSVSGRDVSDKFARFGLQRAPATYIQAPLVEEAIANIECRVCQVVDLGASALLLAQVVDAVADDRHFQDGRWTFANGLQLLHHLGGSEFAISSDVVTAKKP